MIVRIVVLLALICAASAEYRAVNGSYNNLLHPTYGMSFNALHSGVPEGVFHRTEYALYSNVNESISPRDAILNPGVAGVTLLRHPSITSPRYYADQNMLFVYLSQFLAHDMANTGTLPISIVDPSNLRRVELGPEDAIVLGAPTIQVIDDQGVPQDANNATAFIDLSTIYGHLDWITNALRSFQDGKLKNVGRRTFQHQYTNDPNFDLCICTDVITGQPWLQYADDGSNYRKVRSSIVSAFVPQPEIFFGVANSTRCITPGTQAFGGAVMTCEGGAPRPLFTVSCAINFTALNDPKRAPSTYTLPANEWWMPFVSETTPNVPVDSVGPVSDLGKVAAAGDVRNQENYGIYVIHNILGREHNYRADQHKGKNPSWNDEKLFQEARKWTIAIWQHIVVDELIPTMVGNKAFRKSTLNDKYKDSDYDPNVDPRTGNLFASAALRWGHSMTPRRIYPMNPKTNKRIVATKEQLFKHQSGLDNPGTSEYIFVHQGGQVNAFATPDEYMAWLSAQLPADVKPDHAILYGIIKQRGMRLDRFVEDSLTRIEISSCFSPNLTISVPAFTIFRGRTHGLLGYNELRQIYTEESLYCEKKCQRLANGTDSLDCFIELVGKNDVEYAKALADAYGTVENIDPFTGFILEAQTNADSGALLGKTAAAVVLEQMERSRKSDRFWYENSINGFTAKELREIQGTSFRDLIVRHYPELEPHLPNNIFKGSESFY